MKLMPRSCEMAPRSSVPKALTLEDAELQIQVLSSADQVLTLTSGLKTGRFELFRVMFGSYFDPHAIRL